MTLALGLLLWIVAMGLLALASAEFLAGLRARRALGFALASVLALGAVFLFRPEEELKTGDDPAAYFHMAQAFSRLGTFSHVDPALLEVAQCPGRYSYENRNV